MLFDSAAASKRRTTAGAALRAHQQTAGANNQPAPAANNAGANAEGHFRGGVARDTLQEFALLQQPSAAAMSLSAVLPRVLRLGSQPVSWCFVHALDAFERKTEVQPGTVKVVHVDVARQQQGFSAQHRDGRFDDEDEEQDEYQ